jgi:hypothetical protein
MSKLFEAQNGIRFQLEDDNTGIFTTIPYMNETIFTVVGTDILVTNPIDPNTDDVTIDWTLVTSPVTATPADLVEIMYCWISGKLPNVITWLTDTPVVYDAGCNALQSFSNDLYWRGVLISGGGGGGITTADNGLDLSTPTNVQLGGDLIQTTQLTLDGTANNFFLTSPLTTGGNTSIYMIPSVLDKGTVGMSGTAGAVQVDGSNISLSVAGSGSIIVKTPNVLNSIATQNQVLTLVNVTSGEVEYKDGYTEAVIELDALVMAGLGTSGAILLPNLAAGQYYNIESIIMEFTPNTTPYSLIGIGTFQLNYGNSGCQIDTQFVAGFSQNVVMIKDPLKNVATLVYNWVDTQAGDAVILTTDTSVDPVGGDGTIRVIVRYNIRTFGVI